MTNQTGILRRKIYHNKEWNKFLRGNASSPKVGRPQGLRCSRSFRPIAGPIYQPGATRMMSNKKALDNRENFPVEGEGSALSSSARADGSGFYAARSLCSIFSVPSGAAVMMVRQSPSLMVITLPSVERSHTRCFLRFLIISGFTDLPPFYTSQLRFLAKLYPKRIAGEGISVSGEITQLLQSYCCRFSGYAVKSRELFNNPF